jgi:tetratricopeptide (TPR) repeat protein
MAVVNGNVENGLLGLDRILVEYADLLQASEYNLYEDIQARRASSLALLGRCAEALPLLRAATSFTFERDFDRTEDKQRVYFFMGICQSKLDEVSSAKEAFLKAIGFGLKNEIEAQARYRIAILYFQARAFAQTKYHLEIIFQTYQSDIPEAPRKYVYQLLSRTCHFLGEEKDAKRYFETAGKLPQP